MDNWDLVWLTLLNEIILIFVYILQLEYFTGELIMGVFETLGWFFIIGFVGFLLLVVAHSYCDYGESSLIITIMINIFLILIQAGCIGSLTQAIFLETLQIWPIVFSVIWILIIAGELEYFVINEWLK